MRTVGPAIRPVTLTEAKTTLRIGSANTKMDPDILESIDAATEQVEADTNRICASQTYVYSRDWFPAPSNDERLAGATKSMELPLRPIQSIDDITYYDTADPPAQQTLDTSVYTLDKGRRWVRLQYDQNWPDYTMVPNGIQVKFVAGYDDQTELIPRLIKRAILLQVGKWFSDPVMESAEAFSKDSAYERIIMRLGRTSYP